MRLPPHNGGGVRNTQIRAAELHLLAEWGVVGHSHYRWRTFLSRRHVSRDDASELEHKQRKKQKRGQPTAAPHGPDVIRRNGGGTDPPSDW
jgi:(p)ppGpp synthase/HD superfamily hydrolase